MFLLNVVYYWAYLGDVCSQALKSDYELFNSRFSQSFVRSLRNDSLLSECQRGLLVFFQILY